MEGAHQAEDCALRARMVLVDNPTSLHDPHVQQQESLTILSRKTNRKPY